MAYSVTIQDLKQPLLKFVKKGKKQFTQNAKDIKPQVQYGYLVPELILFSGLTQAHQKDRRIMQKLGEQTRMDPTNRMQKCEDILDKLDKNITMFEILNSKKLNGFMINSPTVLYANQSKQPQENGIMKCKFKLRQASHFKDWVMVYSYYDKEDDNQADEAFNLLKFSSKIYGITFDKPAFLLIKAQNRNPIKISDWKQKLKIDYQKNGSPQIYLFLLKPNEQKFYNELKRFTTNDLQSVSQVIRSQSFRNRQKNQKDKKLSAASKVVVQMCAKQGGIPWQIKNSHPYFNEKLFMYGAFSYSSSIDEDGKRQQNISFVGTTNSTGTEIYSQTRIGIKQKQNVQQQIISDIFLKWAQTFYKLNKTLPSLIILYRQALSEYQSQDQIPRTQIPALESSLSKISQSTQCPAYNPQILLLTVTTKTTTRFFLPSSQSAQSPHSSKSTQLLNPNPGSVITSELSSNKAYDFHMVSHLAPVKACAMPVLYRVVYDTSRMPEEAIVGFTYQQCYGYYNWEGAVKVPACLQMANKLAKLISKSIKEQGDGENRLAGSYYFL